MNFIDYKNLKKIALEKKEIFKKAEPYPHLIIDNFLPLEYALKIAREFPNENEINWVKHSSGANADSENIKGIKLHCQDENEFPYEIKKCLQEFNSQGFLHFLRDLSGVEYIFGDPYYNGCGLHSTGKGGRLMIHADMNRYPFPSLAEQYLNCIYFVSEGWDNSWGGALELWDKKVKKCIKSINPTFNRLVIFRTDRQAFHGHPHELKCPDNRRRNTLATYFYIPMINSQVMGNQFQPVLWRRTNKLDRKISKKYIKFVIYSFLTDFMPPVLFRKIIKLKNQIKKFIRPSNEINKKGN